MHRPEQYFTRTKLFYDGRELHVGEFLRTRGGSVYLIERVRRSLSRPRRRYVDVLRYDPAQVPAGAIVHPLYWYPRRRRKSRIKIV